MTRMDTLGYHRDNATEDRRRFTTKPDGHQGRTPQQVVDPTREDGSPEERKTGG